MKTILLLLLLTGATAYAQTSTPSPSLGVGFYEFEDLASPEIQCTGCSLTTVGGSTVTAIDGTFSFVVHGSMIVIDRVMDGDEWIVCVNTTCQTISNDGYDPADNVIYRVGIPVEVGDTIEIEATGQMFDSMWIINGTIPTPVFLPVIATPAYRAVTGLTIETTEEANGQIVTTEATFSYEMSVGELVISTLLGVVALVGLMTLGAVLWKR